MDKSETGTRKYRATKFCTVAARIFGKVMHSSFEVFPGMFVDELRRTTKVFRVFGTSPEGNSSVRNERCRPRRKFLSAIKFASLAP